MKRVLLFCLPAAMLFVLLPAAATARTATVLSCGDTITTSITLHANLNCSAFAGNGLNVGASGIVIRLNGYSIIGGGGAYRYSGISNVGYNNVIVNGHNIVTGKNGTIRNFYYDYYSEDAQGETVTKVHFVLDGRQNYYGLYTWGGGVNTYSYDTVKNAAYGFFMNMENGDKFAHNTLTGNQVGGLDQLSAGATWTANLFSYNTAWGYVEAADLSTILTGNTSSHNGDAGFHLICNGSTTVVVKYNTATYNGGDGVNSSYCYSGSFASTFTGNKTNHNAGAGISSTYDVNAKFNLNTANANTINGFSFLYPAGYAITKNVSNGNGKDGVYFSTGGSYFPSLVSYNSSSSNGDYGYNADALVSGSHDTGSTNTLGLFNNVSG